jgi:hypothetical protein
VRTPEATNEYSAHNDAYWKRRRLEEEEKIAALRSGKHIAYVNLGDDMNVFLKTSVTDESLVGLLANTLAAMTHRMNQVTGYVVRRPCGLCGLEIRVRCLCTRPSPGVYFVHILDAGLPSNEESAWIEHLCCHIADCGR